jgi:anti-sigma regulatory factor (Ser/Thr protein kinase)
VAGIPNVRLNLSSRPENVLLVRQALRGLADMVALDAIELNDISTALSEACNNVVAHAYPGGTGPMDVEMTGSADGLELLIRDRGCGLQPHASEPSEIGGIGIPVMLALADSVEFAGADGEGTDVRMRFATPKAARLAGEASSQDAAEEVLIGADGDQDGVYLAVGPPALASSVLARVLAAVAARAHLSTERIATTRPLAEQLVDHLSNEDEIWHMALAATVAPRQLDLRIVSLPAGSSLAELPPALEELTECHRVSRTGSVEVLALRLHESRPGPRE